jgi:hypothetical protein
MKTTHLVVVLGLLAISSCSPGYSPTTELPGTNGIGDGGLISGEPCGPPCFLGVTPGINTAKDVIPSLELFGISSLCFHENVVIYCPTIPIFYHFTGEEKSICDITFNPLNVTLQDVINKYGAPSGWEFSMPLDESGEPVGTVTLHIYYFDIKTMIELEYQESEIAVYLANPESSIFRVVYLAEVEETYTYKWHGYGQYSP